MTETWNQPNRLPPVLCPIVILVDGESLRAERTSHLTNRNNEMTYRLADGDTIVGRFPWTYP